MAGNIKSGVKIFNVTGSLSGIEGINGITDSYTISPDSTTIKAGDFVNLTTNFNSSSSISGSARGGMYISSVALTSNKVFITHCGNDGYLYGTVCTINGTTITKGTNTKLSSINLSGTPSIVALSDSKVFIAYSGSSSYYLYGMVCSISGTTISVGTDIQLSTTDYTGSGISVVALSSSKVLVAHCYAMNKYQLYGMICTISGTSISKGSDTAIKTTNWQGNSISAVKLSDSKVFIAHNDSSDYTLGAIVCTISGNTITAGTSVSLSNIKKSGSQISAIALSDSKVFIAHSRSDSYYLNGIVCTINGTTITPGTDTSLSNTSYIGYVPSTIMVGGGKIFIVSGYGSTNTSRSLIGILCNITDYTITAADKVTVNGSSYTGYFANAIKLLNNKIFIAHSADSNVYLYARIGYVNAVTTYTTNANVYGVAVGSGSPDTDISVVFPSY